MSGAGERGERDGPLCDDDRDVAPYVENAVGICGGYLYAGASERVLEWLCKDGMMLGGGRCTRVSERKRERERESRTLVVFW